MANNDSDSLYGVDTENDFKSNRVIASSMVLIFISVSASYSPAPLS
jgi:hypothetical protein